LEVDFAIADEFMKSLLDMCHNLTGSYYTPTKVNNKRKGAISCGERENTTKIYGISQYFGVLKMTKLFIGNVHRDATEHDLRDLFESFGAVEEIDSHAYKGFGFVVSNCENVLL